MNWQAFKANVHPSHFIFLLLILIGVLFPERLAEQIDALTKEFTSHFDWLILIFCTSLLIFCLYLALSRYGRIRLGDHDDRPEYGTLSWMAMLFAAGIGSGLVFHGAAEPLYHTVQPPQGDGVLSAQDAARQSLVITYLHWGLRAWAIYAMTALVIAYFSFRHERSMLPASSLGRHAEGMRGTLVNTLCVISVVTGITTAISFGVIMIYDGLERILPFTPDKDTSFLIILSLMCLCYSLSAATAIGKGIKYLSLLNVFICVLLLFFVLFEGPTAFMLQVFVYSLADYVAIMIPGGLQVEYFSSDRSWASEQMIIYYMWWIAWAPFVGVFVARISRGRTIRQFLLCMLFLPSLICFLWFSVMGGAGIYIEQFVEPGFGQHAVKDMASVSFALLEMLPWSEVTVVLMVLLIFVFLITSADSGTYVLAMFTSDGHPNPSKGQRLYWGIMLGAVTAGILLLSRSSLEFIRSIVVVGAVWYFVVMILQMIALWVELRREDIPKAE